MFKKNVCAALISGIVLTILGVAFKRHEIAQWANETAKKSTEEMCGKAMLAPEHEQFIRDIAQEMNITRPFEVRKTNTTQLAGLGYYNAFVIFPRLWDVIPAGNEPYMYVSEGFFEDMLPAEQRFLIGHELIHAREAHCLYYPLGMLLAVLAGFLVWLLLVRVRVRALVQCFVPAPYLVGTVFVVNFALLTVLSSLVPQIVGNAVRRQQEWQADVESVAILNSHEGGLGFIHRMYRDFGMSLHNPHYGILSDHPSSWDRREFFLNKKHNSTT